MAKNTSKILTILVCLVGAIFCGDNSYSDDSSLSYSSDSSYSFDSSDEFRTPASYFQYKVKALNTALYYILEALQDDIKDNVEVDINCLKRVNIIMTLIKSFLGEVDETNALMLGQILRTLPSYLKVQMDEVGIDFAEYTEVPRDDVLLTTDTI